MNTGDETPCSSPDSIPASTDGHDATGPAVQRALDMYRSAYTGTSSTNNSYDSNRDPSPSSQRRSRHSIAAGSSSNESRRYQFYVPTTDSNNNPQATSSVLPPTGGADRRGSAPDPPEVVTAPTSSGEEAAQKVRSRLIRLQNRSEKHRSRSFHVYGGSSGGGGDDETAGNNQGRDWRKSQSSSAVDNDEYDSPKSYTKFAEDGSGIGSSRGSPNQSPKNDTSKQQLEHILNETEDEDLNDNMDDDDFPSVNMDPIESDEEGDNKYYESAPNSPIMQSPNDDYKNNAPSSAPMNSNRSSKITMEHFLTDKGERFKPPLSNDGKKNSQQTNNLKGGLNRFAPPLANSSKSGYSTSRSMPIDPLLSDGIDILENAAKQAQAKEEAETLNDSINYLRNLQLADQNNTSEQQLLAQMHRGAASAPQDEDYTHHAPRKLSSNPAADHIKKGRFLTAEEAMNYVMSQSNRTGAITGGEESMNQAANDINKAYAFLNNMTSEEIAEYGLTGRAKVMESFANSDQVSIEEDDGDDEFERNTSLSMHAEEKFGAVVGSSRHAEEKQGLPTIEPPSSDTNVVNSMSASWKDNSSDRKMSYPDEYSSNNNAALGPRNKKPGGVTGVNLGEYTKSPQQYQADKLDSFSEHSLNSEGHNSAEDEGYTTPPDYGDIDFQSTGLMTVLCGHLLPLKFDYSIQNDDSFCGIASMFVQNSQNQKPIWNDEDPDEPGYVVHRLTNAELTSVEYAFEKLITAFGESAAANNNFERDLEEAEKVLDEDDKRYVTETKGLLPHEGSEDSSDRASPGTQDSYDDVAALSPDEDGMRECVPDFPGIFPPGKGKQGELECFYLPIITKSQKTGFEPTKDLVLKPGSVFANNYLVQGELGSAAFSTAYRCVDLASEEDDDGYQDEVCLKVIKNTKDYFDQSIDEIKILRLLKDTGKVQENNIVEMKSFFYHREHLVIVTELLRQNMYEFGKSIIESRGPAYFTRNRLSHITRQCLIALKFVHELGLMHCDIKPENILLRSYSRALVKVIDFGSSSFTTDRQSSYIQSRSYRAPEVILGLPYDGRIDMWSLGCVIAEMYTGEVTFQNDSELSMLSRIEAICGPFPKHMIAKGRNSHRIFTDSGLIYEKVSRDEDDDDSRCSADCGSDQVRIYQPKMTTMAARLGFDADFMEQRRVSGGDQKRAMFVDFVTKLLTIDPDVRLTAKEALKHPWIISSLDLTEDEIRYPPSD